MVRQWTLPDINLFAWGDAPEAEALDALAQPWKFRLAYAFPPPLLRVIRKIAVFSGVFLLVTPFWPAQKWFPAVLGLQVMHVHRLLATLEVINLTLGLPPLSHLPLLVWRIFGGLRGLAVSDGSFRLICGSWRSSTAARYNSIWRSFKDFLSARGVLLLCRSDGRSRLSYTPCQSRFSVQNDNVASLRFICHSSPCG